MGKILTLLLLALLLACQSESRQSLPDAIRHLELQLPSGEVVKTRLVFTEQDQVQGLSGTQPADFGADEGMLFYYTEDGEKYFWMPDTYFDLDLIYLDKDLKVLDIIRRLPHYIGRSNEHLIPRARGVWCRHVLEMKADSALSQKITMGMTLKWSGKYSLEETDKKIRDYHAAPPTQN